MEEIGVEERVKFWVELWVVEVFLLDEVEEAGEREERGCASNVVGVAEEVHQKLWF